MWSVKPTIPYMHEVPSYFCNQCTESIFPAIHLEDSNTTDDFIHYFDSPISYSNCFKPGWRGREIHQQ